MSAMLRQVEAEWLDALDADDAGARRSREDLRRINLLMGSLPIALAALDRAAGERAPRTILELGAGDGSLMARIARRRALRWPDVEVTLVDRQRVVSLESLARMRAAGWRPRVLTCDALDWAARPPVAAADVVFANLFVHHFAGDALTRLLHGVAVHGRAFACCEPRRDRLSRAAGRLGGGVGAGRVARPDAVASVRAGFRDGELSASWTGTAGCASSAGGGARTRWTLAEYEAGPFTHCFVAARAPGRADGAGRGRA
jgi:hypothetical protein